MSATIYLMQNDDQLVELTEQYYDSEARLQELLARYPKLLAGDQIDQANPRRWLLISREVGVPWEEGGSDQMSLDHLFLDQDAIPTLVEVKRSGDTRIRREVVGQMLDYAANAVVYWPAESLRARFEAACEARGQQPVQIIAELIGTDEEDEAAVEAYWQRARENLQAGRLRLLFVADEIPPQLRRIVEFLNQQMGQTEVLAVEIKQYAGKGLRTLVPRVIGQTAETQQRKASAPKSERQWDEASFFDELERRRGQNEVQVARRILEWGKANMPEIWWGRGTRSGSFIPGIIRDERWHQLFGVWTNGHIEIQFQYMKSRGSLDDSQRLELLQRLNQIPGVFLPEDSIFRRPSIALSVFTDEAALQQLLSALDWALAAMKSQPFEFSAIRSAQKQD